MLTQPLRTGPQLGSGSAIEQSLRMVPTVEGEDRPSRIGLPIYLSLSGRNRVECVVMIDVQRLDNSF